MTFKSLCVCAPMWLTSTVGAAQPNMNGPMGYYPNQYGAPMNGMGGNMRPAYGTPNGMPGGMMPGMGRPPMMHNNYNYGNYGNNNFGNYGMPPMMQQPQPPMYGGPARGGMGPRGRGQQAGRMVRICLFLTGTLQSQCSGCICISYHSWSSPMASAVDLQCISRKQSKVAMFVQWNCRLRFRPTFALCPFTLGQYCWLRSLQLSLLSSGIWTGLALLQGPGARGPGRGGRGGRGEGPMGGMGPGHNMNPMGGQGHMGGGPSGPGPQPHPQMNGTTASAIHALPASLPGQSSSSALTQKLAGTQDGDLRRTMLGKPLVI